MATLSKTLLAPGFEATDPVGLIINGTNLNDTLFGTAYTDEIHGRDGADVLFGYGGNDFLFGDAGNDTLIGGAGADALNGGAGFDTASYASAATSVYVNLATNTGVYGDAQGDTFNSIEKIVGSSNDDWLVANDTGVVFEGGAGHDYLLGGAGLDALNGGAGSDTLEGGRGFDVLTGGEGADLFIFNRGDGPDVVMDFQQGVDKIALNGFTGFHGIGALGIDGELRTGTELPTVIHNGPPRGDRDMVFYDTDDCALYQLSPYGDATLLATFANGVQLQTSDFINV
ncbi:MAG TPA: calcium-binding protein [Xanthobacteraceae bacterium]|nr:calcium-binding protein [Xanthobacteraceae bacterium]